MAYLSPYRSADPAAASKPFHFRIGHYSVRLGFWQPKVAFSDASVRWKEKKFWHTSRQLVWLDGKHLLTMHSLPFLHDKSHVKGAYVMPES